MVKTIPVRVKCRREPYSIKTAYIIASDSSNNGILGFCNGCDDLSGDNACTECIEKITKMFNSENGLPPEPVYLP